MIEILNHIGKASATLAATSLMLLVILCIVLVVLDGVVVCIRVDLLEKALGILACTFTLSLALALVMALWVWAYT